MIKAIKKIIIICLTFCLLFSITGCKEDTVRVTFKQSGWSDMIREVKVGETLKSIPKPKGVDGYEVVWDVTDFSNLQKNITVNAVLSPKEYTITYDLGSRKGDSFAKIEGDVQTVTFDSTVITFKPTCSGYSFLGWTVKGKNLSFNDGKYIYAEDIILVANWEVSDDDEDRFSPIIPSN